MCFVFVGPDDMDRHEGQLGGESGEEDEERDTCIEVGGASGVCIEVGGASGVIINNNNLFIWCTPHR